jgi:CMP-N-acetylneuraminate monooxygenase
MTDTIRVPLGPLASFRSFPAPVTIGARAFFLVHHDGAYRLLSTVCPHQGGTVFDEGSRFECPLHNWKFDRETGRCLNAPSRALASYPVEIEDGVVVAHAPIETEVERVRQQTSAKAGLSIRLLSHACLEISLDGFTLLTDPWLDGLAFLGAWAPYPSPAASAAELRPNAILITHEHSDHFHEPTLQLFDRATTIYVPDFPNRRIPARLAAMGFNDVRILRFGEETAIAPDWSLIPFEPSSLWNDALVLLDIAGFRVLNANDAGINTRIAAMVGHVDLLAVQFSAGASGYPWTWTHLTADQKIAISKKMCEGKLALIRESAAAYGASAVLPFASHFTLWHPDHLGHAAMMTRNTLDDVKQAMAGTAVQVIDLLPGDLWDIGHAEIRREHSSIGAPDVTRYQAYFAAQHPTNEDLTEAGLFHYLDRLNAVPEIALCEELTVRMIGRSSRGADVDVSFAIANGRLSKLDASPARANLTMTMPLAVMRAVVVQDLSWDEAFIGYWCEFDRYPNVYHAGFWRLFQAPYYRKPIGSGRNPLPGLSAQSTIAELLETFGDDADRILRRYGLYCRGCHHSTSESIELAGRQHGVEPRRVEQLVKELNRALLGTHP